MGWSRASSSVLVQKRFLAAFLNSCILTAYIRGLTIELKRYSANNDLEIRKKTAGHNLLHIRWKTTVQIAQGRIVRKEATVTITKVTVSFLSVERIGPALGERGLFFTVEMIIAFESVRMRTTRKVEDANTYRNASDARKSRRAITDDKVNANDQLHKIIVK